MTYTQESCRDFIAALASKSPTPGGGGASALVGAVGMALGSMVASLTTGKAKYAEVQDEISRIATQAEALQTELLALVERDAEAFAPLAQAYGLPKATETERVYKAAVMEEALRVACATPLAIMERVCEAAELIERLSEIGSALAISDAGCAVACCRAALTGAALNVSINTKVMRDRAFAAICDDKADSLLQKYVPVCERVYQSVASRLRA